MEEKDDPFTFKLSLSDPPDTSSTRTVNFNVNVEPVESEENEPDEYIM